MKKDLKNINESLQIFNGQGLAGVDSDVAQVIIDAVDEDIISDNDDLCEGIVKKIKDNRYSKESERLKKEYTTKLEKLRTTKERKLAQIREQKNDKIALCKTTTEGDKVRATYEAKENAIKDQFNAARENLLRWKEKQQEALKQKRDKGIFSKSRRNASKDAKYWKKTSDKSLKKTEKLKMK